MSLEHAILGFLNYGSSSGYDLKKAFDASVQHFWPADQSQIYRTLTRLSEQGWAELQVVEQQDRPDRKVYHITTAGREELTHWLSTPLPPDTYRRASLVQIFFAGQLNNDQIISLLETQANSLRDKLARYNQLPQTGSTYAEAIGSPREVFFWAITLESGVKTTQAQLDWLESVIDRLKKEEYTFMFGSR